MAYDENLVQRLRTHLDGVPGLTEKKMFGGVGFMVNGNMACGVHKQYFIARLSTEHYEQAMMKPHVKPFDITGRPMKGWIMVSAEGIGSEDDLKEWIQQGVTLARSLPWK
jgi:TfoX/Sxy family transcriptional regulator of competence genes